MVSKNSGQTKKLAADLAQKIAAKTSKRQAVVIALIGELGAGKTTFVKGFAKTLKIKNRILSPTFIIFRVYKLRFKNYKALYHVDCYRLQNAKELIKLGFKKIMKNPKNIILIEWADKIRKILPKNTIWIKFQHGKIKNERIITITR